MKIFHTKKKNILGIVVSKSPPSIPLWRNSLLILQNNLANNEFAGQMNLYVLYKNNKLIHTIVCATSVCKLRKLSLTLFWQKFRETNLLTKWITRYLVDLTKYFSVRVNFWFLQCAHFGKKFRERHGTYNFHQIIFLCLQCVS